MLHLRKIAVSASKKVITQAEASRAQDAITQRFLVNDPNVVCVGTQMNDSSEYYVSMGVLSLKDAQSIPSEYCLDNGKQVKIVVVETERIVADNTANTSNKSCSIL